MQSISLRRAGNPLRSVKDARRAHAPTPTVRLQLFAL